MLVNDEWREVKWGCTATEVAEENGRAETEWKSSIQ